MSTAVEGFKWLEELRYNLEYFGKPTTLRGIQRELGFLHWKDRRPGNGADNYLEGLIENATELITACNHLRAIIAEEVKSDG